MRLGTFIAADRPAPRNRAGLVRGGRGLFSVPTLCESECGQASSEAILKEHVGNAKPGVKSFAMSSSLEHKRSRLVAALKNLPPQMRERLQELKAEGEEQRKRPDLLWYLLLQ